MSIQTRVNLMIIEINLILVNFKKLEMTLTKTQVEMDTVKTIVDITKGQPSNPTQNIQY
jgi:hypothetical protein